MTRVELLTLAFVLEVKKLVKETPNDMELGKKIRIALEEHTTKIEKVRTEEKNI